MSLKQMFDDPGNRKALGMDQKKVVYQINIDRPCTLRTSDKEKLGVLKSALVQNDVKFKIDEHPV